MVISTAHETALKALAANLSTIPPRMDGSKAPQPPGWKHYQERMATKGEIQDWYSKRCTGVGLVTGRISGNLECLDFDIRDAWTDFKALAEKTGLRDLVVKVGLGYGEETPNGIHLMYRCKEISGNTKLAKVPDLDAPGQWKTLIETRGEGGYIIVAPTSGPVNPAGDYVLKAGGFDTIVEITPEERDALHSLARTFDESQRDEYVPQQPPTKAGELFP